MRERKRAGRATALLTLSRQFQRIAPRSRLLQTQRYVQHGDTSCLLHSVAVAYYSCRAARLLHLSVCYRELLRGALLHDYFLYDWHDPDPSHRLHGFTHPSAALANASTEFTLSAVERDVIQKHMFPLTPLPPRYRESLLVCLTDKACSLYETLCRNTYPFLRRWLRRALARSAKMD